MRRDRWHEEAGTVSARGMAEFGISIFRSSFAFWRNLCVPREAKRPFPTSEACNPHETFASSFDRLSHMQLREKSKELLLDG